MPTHAVVAPALQKYKELLLKLHGRRFVDERAWQWKQQAREKKEGLREVAQEVAIRVFQGNTAYGRFREVLLRGRAAMAKRRDAVAKLIPFRQRNDLDGSMEHLLGKETTLHNILRGAALSVVGGASRYFMLHLNSTQVQGVEHLRQALLHRKEGQALITVSNHVAAMDDPLVSAAIVPPEIIGRSDMLRWTLCASDRCFKGPVMSSFFRMVKVLPVQRGGGLEQAGMQAAFSRIQKGDWVHIFPEGTRSEDGTIGKVKRGVGRMVAAAEIPPVLLPFVHKGMEKVMPKGAAVPRIGQSVRVVVGKPIHVEDLLQRYALGTMTAEELFEGVSGRVEFALRKLHLALEDGNVDLPASNEMFQQGSPSHFLQKGPIRMQWNMVSSPGNNFVGLPSKLQSARDVVVALSEGIASTALQKASRQMQDRHFARSTALLANAVV